MLFKKYNEGLHMTSTRYTALSAIPNETISETEKTSLSSKLIKTQEMSGFQTYFDQHFKRLRLSKDTQKYYQFVKFFYNFWFAAPHKQIEEWEGTFSESTNTHDQKTALPFLSPMTAAYVSPPLMRATALSVRPFMHNSLDHDELSPPSYSTGSTSTALSRFHKSAATPVRSTERFPASAASISRMPASMNTAASSSISISRYSEPSVAEQLAQLRAELASTKQEVASIKQTVEQQAQELREFKVRVIASIVIVEKSEEEKARFEEEMIRIYLSESLWTFYETILEKLGSKLNAFQILRSKLVKYSSTKTSVAETAGSAASVVPVFGAVVNAGVSGGTAAYKAKQIHDMKPIVMFFGSITNTEKLIEEFARRLTIAFSDMLSMLDNDSVTKMAREFVAKKIIKMVTDEINEISHMGHKDKLKIMFARVTRDEKEWLNDSVTFNNSVSSSVHIEKPRIQGILRRSPIGVKLCKVSEGDMTTLQAEHADAKIVENKGYYWKILRDGKTTSDDKEDTFKYPCREELYSGEVIPKGQKKHSHKRSTIAVDGSNLRSLQSSPDLSSKSGDSKDRSPSSPSSPSTSLRSGSMNSGSAALPTLSLISSAAVPPPNNVAVSLFGSSPTGAGGFGTPSAAVVSEQSNGIISKPPSFNTCS